MNEDSTTKILLNGRFQQDKPALDSAAVTIYEVLRVISGVPVFVEDHLSRLYHSLALVNKTIPISVTELTAQIELLIEAININAGNIKISIHYFNERNSPDIVMEQISHKYPSPETYSEGVELITYPAKRANPNAKIQNNTLRQVTDEMIRKFNAYDILYIHPDGYITECSRSNIFFISKGQLITAPAEDVLEGITRLKVNDICEENNIPLHFRRINRSELNTMDGAFISGTSPKILPVKKIDTITYSVKNPLQNQIIQEYDLLITGYISSYQKKSNS